MIPNELQPYSGSKVVLVGATGFVGRAIWRALDRLQADVYAVGRNAVALRALIENGGRGGVAVPVDVADSAALASELTRITPHLLINAAGYGVAPAERDPQIAELINASLPASLVRFMARHGDPDWAGQAVVHIGSGFEYGSVVGPVLESTPARPHNLYAETKLRGTDNLLQTREALAMRAVAARIFTVYGPGEHDHRLLPSLLRAAATGERLNLTAGLQERDFTFVDDVAEGLLRLGAAAEVPGVVHLATGRNTSIRAFAEEALRVLNAPADLVHFGALPTRPDEVLQGPVSVERLVTAIGWSPRTPIRDGVLATACRSQVLPRVLRERIGC